jgi:integrase
MDLTDEQLIAEAVAVNHAQVGKVKTLDRYAQHLGHLSEYLHSVHGASFYTAKRKHIVMFVSHLQKPGGEKPHSSRFGCEWCRAAGYPDGSWGGPGWSPSTIKGILSAVHFLYQHFACEDDLPSIDPSAHVKGPRVEVKPQYTPSKENIGAVLDAPGRPRDRLLACWMAYAPSRRQTFADARWRDLDLNDGLWHVVGRYGKPDTFTLHPALVRELRRYHRWQHEVYAHRHRAVRDALEDEDTAYVLLTCNGRPMHPNQISKMLKWRGRRANVAVHKTDARHDCPGGTTSKLAPHAMRRGWATTALNDGQVPLEVIRDVLKHQSVTTTERHYAHSKPERARDALRSMRY